MHDDHHERRNRALAQPYVSLSRASARKLRYFRCLRVTASVNVTVKKLWHKRFSFADIFTWRVGWVLTFTSATNGRFRKKTYPQKRCSCESFLNHIFSKMVLGPPQLPFPPPPLPLPPPPPLSTAATPRNHPEHAQGNSALHPTHAMRGIASVPRGAGRGCRTVVRSSTWQCS